jgi:hypothetical protein
VGFLCRVASAVPSARLIQIAVDGGQDLGARRGRTNDERHEPVGCDRAGIQIRDGGVAQATPHLLRVDDLALALRG